MPCRFGDVSSLPAITNCSRYCPHLNSSVPLFSHCHLSTCSHSGHNKLSAAFSRAHVVRTAEIQRCMLDFHVTCFTSPRNMRVEFFPCNLINFLHNAVDLVVPCHFLDGTWTVCGPTDFYSQLRSEHPARSNTNKRTIGFVPREVRAECDPRQKKNQSQSDIQSTCSWIYQSDTTMRWF